jgi:ankyrin repeat protein
VKPVLIILAASFVFVSFSHAKGKSPELIRAAKEGNVSLLQTLIRQGEPVDVTNVENATALMVAARQGQLQAAKVLLSNGAKVNFQSKCATYHTPLFCAVLGSHHDVARLLLEHGADRKLRDSVEKTVLDRARERQDARMVRLLESEIVPSAQAAGIQEAFPATLR